MWRLTAVLVCAAWLAACSKGSQTSSTASPNSETSPAVKTASANGANVYRENCATCHGANASGQPGVFPPLKGNPVVTGDPKQVIHIVKSGLTGPIEVNAKSYNGQMPPWSGVLNNDQIAAVVSYIRSSWGNKAGPVAPAQVAATK